MVTLATVAATIERITREVTQLHVLSEDERKNHHRLTAAHNSSYKNDQSSDDSTDANNGHDKPTFVLHVGLPKTATSFLQCSLCANWDITSSILEHDIYEYIGTCPANCGGKGAEKALIHRFEAFFRDGSRAQEGGVGPVLHNTTGDIMMKESHEKPVVLSGTLQRRIESALARGYNAFIVYEGAHRFPDDHIKKLADFLKPNWNVKIVIGYRPLYEWLPSKYNSITKSLRVGSWPGEIGRNGKIIKELLSFDMDNRTEKGFSEMVYEIEVKYRKHPAEIVQNNYGLHFENVHILDSTQIPDAKGDGDPLLEHFFLQYHSARPSNLYRHSKRRVELRCQEKPQHFSE